MLSNCDFLRSWTLCSTVQALFSAFWGVRLLLLAVDLVVTQQPCNQCFRHYPFSFPFHSVNTLSSSRQGPLGSFSLSLFSSRGHFTFSLCFYFFFLASCLPFFLRKQSSSPGLLSSYSTAQGPPPPAAGPTVSSLMLFSGM